MPRSGILISLVLLDIQVNGTGGLAINIPKLAVVARPQEIGHAVALDAVFEGQGAVERGAAAEIPTGTAACRRR